MMTIKKTIWIIGQSAPILFTDFWYQFNDKRQPLSWKKNKHCEIVMQSLNFDPLCNIADMYW